MTWAVCIQQRKERTRRPLNSGRTPLSGSAWGWGTLLSCPCREHILSHRRGPVTVGLPWGRGNIYHYSHFTEGNKGLGTEPFSPKVVQLKRPSTTPNLPRYLSSTLQTHAQALLLLSPLTSGMALLYCFTLSTGGFKPTSSRKSSRITHACTLHLPTYPQARSRPHPVGFYTELTTLCHCLLKCHFFPWFMYSRKFTEHHEKERLSLRTGPNCARPQRTLD